MIDVDDTIFRIKSFIKALEGDEGFSGLDQTSIDILTRIGGAYARRESLRSSDLAENPDFGSPASVYRKLSQLTADGWVTSTQDPADARSRFIIPTSRTLHAFNRMSSKLKQQITAPQA
jgi:DNA-binding MarR family transcriptional regulator